MAVVMMIPTSVKVMIETVIAVVAVAASPIATTTVVVVIGTGAEAVQRGRNRSDN